MSTDRIAAYWDDYAEVYDREPDHGLLDPDTRAAWRHLLRTWLPAPPSVVADLACGTGTLTALAAELGHRVCGFDISGEMVARAKVKVACSGADVEVSQADVTAPPLGPATVDAVLARHILWTLPDPHAALAAWAAAVRPGGRLVLVEGRWASVGDACFDEPDRMPWSGGVSASALCAVVEPLASRVQVVTLSDPRLWGRAIDDERYLLVATLGHPSPPGAGRP